jgi:hypothetical protein
LAAAGPSAKDLDALLAGAPAAAKTAPAEEFILPGIPKVAQAKPPVAPAAGTARPKKGGCVPGFYSSLSEDPDWYYGVAKSAERGQARNLAVDNLASSVKGEVAVGFEESELETLAGPGRDRIAVSEAVAQLLPATTVLGDRTQDVYAECDGEQYAMVRARKDRVHQFMRQDRGFRSALSDRLGRP